MTRPIATMTENLHQLTVLQLQAAQAGDREALEQLFTRYRDRVLQVVSILVGKRRRDLAWDEEDIVQDTLFEAFRGLESFEPRTDGAFLHWLSKLAENNLRDAIRRQGARKRGEGRVRPLADLSTSYLASSLFLGREPTPSEVARVHERIEQIESALIALPDRERRVFVGCVLCGVSFAEITQELGLGAESSARSLYTRVKARLSAFLPDPVC